MLSNKVALIIGASSGIGRATAKLFAQQGATVVVTSRRKNELETLIKEITQNGGEAISRADKNRVNHFSKLIALC